MLILFTGACSDKLPPVGDGGKSDTATNDARTDGSNPGPDQSTPGDTGTPGDNGTPGDTAAPTDGDIGTPADTGTPGDTTTPADTGSPVDTGTPSDGNIGTCGALRLCAAGYFCEYNTCTPTKATIGQCRLIPTGTCAATTKLECGCNGVTYFNTCLRQQAKVSSVATGVCSTTAATCGGITSTKCAVKGTVCVRQGSSSCPTILATGKCWVLPATCSSKDSTGYRDCSASPAKCASLCTAAKSGRYYADASCLIKFP
ncbi:MAG: hypothetical protein KC503_39635 [Myxococcales bacterium]|nr:hypothetical protein [Myxococcales bacterium]